ncbi:hypothetical protein [Ralstonia pseudosolanacearum]|uniref:hypothetical protein n=1 Tax=Ralstonia pseudosolanacearum TaxID=1310165 RepID=UPI0021AD9C66|nr:hypothetical protein [Ralstonia pseudosolanacearum]
MDIVIQVVPWCRVVQADGAADVLFRVANQMLIQVAQQLFLASGVLQIQVRAIRRLQVCGHDPGFMQNVGQLVFPTCMSRDTLQVLFSLHDKSLECVIRDWAHGVFFLRGAVNPRSIHPLPPLRRWIGRDRA